MKKIVYVIVVLLILLGLSKLLQSNNHAQVAVDEPVVAVETVAVEPETTQEKVVATDVNNAPVVEDEVVVVDEEPGSEAVTVEVVEENPEVTADEGETVVE